MVRLIRADCTDFLRTLDENSVDSVVCDPPYGLGDPPDVLEMLRAWLDTGHLDIKGRGFMAAAWDAFVPQPALWREVYRVLKPGGHALTFAGTRTVDVMGLSLRIAGFEVRDQLAWCYGQGFPKALDVSKALDAAVGAEREVVGSKFGLPGYRLGPTGNNDVYGDGLANGSAKCEITAPTTDLAKQYHDWKTALKPAYEPVLLCRKPLDGTVAANVMAWGTGGLNIGATRTPAPGEMTGAQKQSAQAGGREGKVLGKMTGTEGNRVDGALQGRYPTNLLLDREAARMLDEQNGVRTSGKVTRVYEPTTETSQSMGAKKRKLSPDTVYSDSGGVSRYFPMFDFGAADEEHAADMLRLFYHGKVTKKERNSAGENTHPTLKPIALMAWLCRLVTPPGGVVLDPFMGSGSCGIAAVQEGFQYVGVERDTAYFEIAQRRVLRALAERTT